MNDFLFWFLLQLEACSAFPSNCPEIGELSIWLGMLSSKCSSKRSIYNNVIPCLTCCLRLAFSLIASCYLVSDSLVGWQVELLEWPEQPLFNVSETHVLLSRLQELSLAKVRGDLEGVDPQELGRPALERIRLALASNLGRAILQEWSSFVLPTFCKLRACHLYVSQSSSCFVFTQVLDFSQGWTFATNCLWSWHCC